MIGYDNGGLSADPHFRRGTEHYDEALHILGSRAGLIADESVGQINGRWLKADQFILDESGFPMLGSDGELRTTSVRIRIPRDSWLRRDFTHSKR